ncbi:MAG: XRE family transcriptional regulator [Oscillospiraceae bacterium]
MNRIKELRQTKGWNQSDLGEKLQVQKSAVSKYETGKIPLTDETITKLSKIFEVSADYLLGNTSQPMPVNNHKRGIKIPVLGKVQAGLPMEAIENIIDYEEIDEQMAKSGEFFALQIRGNSMEPKFSEGDIVIVRKQPVVNNGDIAIVLINGDEATVKKFYQKENGITLVATNPSYEPMFFANDDIEQLPLIVLGKVVELRAKF